MKFLLFVLLMFIGCYTQFTNPYKPINSWDSDDSKREYDLMSSDPYEVIDRQFNASYKLDREWGFYYSRWDFIMFTQEKTESPVFSNGGGSYRPIGGNLGYETNMFDHGGFYIGGKKDNVVTSVSSSSSSAPSFKSKPVSSSSSNSSTSSSGAFSSSKKTKSSSSSKTTVQKKSSGKSYKSEPVKSSSKRSGSLKKTKKKK